MPPVWGAPPPGARPSAPKPGTVALRPLTFGELLDGGFTTIQRYPKVMLGMAALVGLAQIVVLIGIALLANWRLAPLIDRMAATVEPMASRPEPLAISDGEWVEIIATALIVVVLSMVGSALMTGLISVTTARGTLGEPTTPGEAWRSAVPHIWRLIAWTLLLSLAAGVTMAVAVGVAALLSALSTVLGAIVAIPLFLGYAVLVVWIGVKLALTPALIVIERRPVDSANPFGDHRPIGIVDAARRSWALTNGRFWRVLGVLFVAGLIAGVIVNIVSYAGLFLGAAIGAGVGGPAGAIIAGVLTLGLSMLGSLFQIVFLGAITALLYVDSRMRAEGLDIQLQRVTNPGRVGAEGLGHAGQDGSPWLVP